MVIMLRKTKRWTRHTFWQELSVAVPNFSPSKFKTEKKHQRGPLGCVVHPLPSLAQGRANGKARAGTPVPFPRSARVTRSLISPLLWVWGSGWLSFLCSVIFVLTAKHAESTWNTCQWLLMSLGRTPQTPTGWTQIFFLMPSWRLSYLTGLVEVF